MFSFLASLSSGWATIQWLLGGCVAVPGGVLYWLLHNGGLSHMDKWLASLEEPLRGKARSRILSGLRALGVPGTADTGCDDLIAGLDDWRSCQVRSQSRMRRLRRAVYPLVACPITALLSSCARVFEGEPLYVTAAFVMATAILTVWMFIEAAPVVWLVLRIGLPRDSADRVKDTGDIAT